MQDNNHQIAAKFTWFPSIIKVIAVAQTTNLNLKIYHTAVTMMEIKIITKQQYEHLISNHGFCFLFLYRRFFHIH